MIDETILSRAANGDVEARNEALLLAMPIIRRFARKMAYGVVQAEDLISEAALAVLREITYYQPSRSKLEHFLLWIIRIAMVRYGRIEHRFYKRWKPCNLDKIPDPIPPNWSEFYERLEQLPREESELLCRYFGIGTLEEDSKTLAAELRLTPSAVRMRIKSILESLRK